MSIDPSDKKNDSKKLNAYARYTGLGFQMLAVIGLCTFGGIKADEYLESDFPIFTMILVPLSAIFAVYLVIRRVMKNKN